MVDFIYNMPPYFLRIAINVTVLLVLLCGNLLVRRYCIRDNIDHDAVNGASAIVSMMYAIFIGFVIFASVNNLSTAEDAARTEAHLVSTINYDASFLPKPVNGEVQQALKNYLNDVVNKEWPAMKQGAVDNSGLESLKQLKVLLLNHRPADADAVNVNVWTDVMQQTNNLFQEHEDRIHYSQNLSLSKGVWYCLISATLVLLVSSSFFFFEDRRKYVILLACIGIITGLLLFLETSINFPYRGYYGVSPDGFKTLLTQQDFW
ncbi:MAG: hypothetical protein V4496_02500 [Pseudomonadota bacterium]